MTYEDIADLPDEEVREYSRSQKATFENAHNRAIEKGKKEDQARREAHMEAKQADGGNT